MKKKTTTIIVALCAAGLIAFGIGACSKSSSSGSSGTLNESDAANVTADAVSPSTGGLVAQVHYAASLSSEAATNSINHKVVDATVACGDTKDTTIAYVSTAGVTPSFNYSLSWAFTPYCTAPAYINFSYNGSGSYSGIVLSTTFNMSGTFKLSGLGTTDYTYNSSFTRSGAVHVKTNGVNFTHTLTITSSNIIYDTATQEITSGTATVSIVLTGSSGNKYTYGGKITFLGDGKATIVLNSGAVYNVAWEVTPA